MESPLQGDEENTKKQQNKLRDQEGENKT